MVVFACNLNTQEAEAGELSQVECQLGVDRKFWGCIVRTSERIPLQTLNFYFSFLTVYKLLVVLSFCKYMNILILMKKGHQG